eukprot:2979019-Pyramimonas_sp.AAC.2
MVKHDLSDLSTQESKLQLEMRAKSELEEMAKARAAQVERQIGFLPSNECIERSRIACAHLNNTWRQGHSIPQSVLNFTFSCCTHLDTGHALTKALSLPLACSAPRYRP